MRLADATATSAPTKPLLRVATWLACVVVAIGTFGLWLSSSPAPGEDSLSTAPALPANRAIELHQDLALFHGLRIFDIEADYSAGNAAADLVDVTANLGGVG